MRRLFVSSGIVRMTRRERACEHFARAALKYALGKFAITQLCNDAFVRGERTKKAAEKGMLQPQSRFILLSKSAGSAAFSRAHDE